MLTVPQAAARTGYSPETIRRWIRAGRLPATKAGTQHMIDERELDRLLEGGGGAAERSPVYADDILVPNEPNVRLLQRIASNPKVLGGKPVIRGTRISVELILEFMAGGWSVEQLMSNYLLQKDDIRACLEYAAAVVREERIFPLAAR